MGMWSSFLSQCKVTRTKSDPCSFCAVVCSLSEDETESLACEPLVDRRAIVNFFIGLSVATCLDGAAMAAQFADSNFYAFVFPSTDVFT